jgi:ABC-type multidrug transport system fused ATPase/permease subunit
LKVPKGRADHQFTVIGEEMSTIAGGQRQRLPIALRATG